MSLRLHFICNQLRVFREAGGGDGRDGELDGAKGVLIYVLQDAVLWRGGKLSVLPVQDGISESAGRLRHERRPIHDGEGYEALVRRMVSRSDVFKLELVNANWANIRLAYG